MMRALSNFSKSWVSALVVLVGLIGCESSGGRLGDDCSSNSDCDTSDYRCVECSVRNTCYFDGFTDVDDDVWACEKYGSGTAVRTGGSSPGGTSSTTGACAYVDSKLNRILCAQKSGSSCSGKFFGTGTSCTGMTCSSNSPSSCSVSGGSSPGGSTTPGGSSTGCVGTHEICNTDNVQGCTITVCGGGPAGCYFSANGKRFSCNGSDVSTCGFDAVQYCTGG